MNNPRADDPGNSRAFLSLAPDGKVGAGRFTLKKILGQGGMGIVWLAHDERLDEDVALKFLPPQIRFDGTGLTALRREATRSRKLTHPNIIRIHDLQEPEGEDAFIAMEFVDGPTLSALRLRQPQEIFSWATLAPLVRQICDALDYAHGERVIHRDLKPGNLMCDGKGRLKLADFGIATIISDSLNRVSANPTSGTPAYMSPQQIDGKAPQPTDDIYSLGATLYELLTGTPPFHTGQIVHQVLHNEPAPPSERLVELGAHNIIPPDVEAMLMACLAKDPAGRPQSARVVADWIGFQPTPHPQSLAATIMVPEEEIQEPVEAASSRKGRWLFGMIILLLFLGVGGWLWAAKLSAKKMQTMPVATNAPTAVTAAPQADTANVGSIIFADDFENAGKPSPWNWGAGVGKFIVQQGTNHFARLEGNHWTNLFGVSTRWLPLKPEWKAVRLSARFRMQNLKANPAFQWSGVDVSTAWVEKIDGVWLDAGGIQREKNDTGWIARSRVAKIPAGAKFVQITLSLDQSTGIADFDDIKVSVVEENKK